MSRSNRIYSTTGYAIGLGVAVVALLVAAIAGSAEAGGVHRAACQPHQQAFAAPIAYAPIITYDASDGLRSAGAEEYAFRRSPSQERLIFLEGFYHAKALELDSGVRTAGPSQPVTLPAATEGGQTTCPDCAKPEEPQAFSAPKQPEPQRFLESTGEPLPPGKFEAFSTSHPTLSAACAGCHSGETPKGELNIGQAVVTAQANADCPTLLNMVNAIATGDMPKGKPMSEVDRLNAIAELLNQ